MWKFEDIPAIDKQYNNQFHAFQRWEINHGQITQKLIVPSESLTPKT